MKKFVGCVKRLRRLSAVNMPPAVLQFADGETRCMGALEALQETLANNSIIYAHSVDQQVNSYLQLLFRERQNNG